MDEVGKLVKGQRLVALLRILPVHVVNADLIEVACDDPFWSHALGRYVVCVPLGLLEGRDHTWVAVPVLASLFG